MAQLELGILGCVRIPAPLSFEGNLVGFKQQFELFMTAFGNDKKEDVKVAILLNVVGPESLEYTKILC